MTISSDVIYIVIILLSTLLLSIIALITLFLRSQAQYTKLRTAGKSDGDDTVIDNAQKIAQEIIKKAEAQALKIVESSKVVNDKYDRIVDVAIKEIINSWGNKSSQVFDKNLTLLDSELKKLIQDIYIKETKSLTDYKGQKMQEIDAKIDEFVKTVGKKILGREISLTEHKKFIQEALDLAHKNGQFT